jgi:hypothetical protein
VPTSSAPDYEREFERFLSGFLRHGRELIPQAHLIEGELCVGSLSKSDDFLCEPEALSANQAIHDRREKRREHRLATNAWAVLQILSPFSDEHLDVRILNVSKNGVGLYTPTGVMPGSLLKVRLKDYLAFGEARYCRPAAEGFSVGVQLHDYVSHGAAPKDILERRKTV